MLYGQYHKTTKFLYYQFLTKNSKVKNTKTSCDTSMEESHSKNENAPIYHTQYINFLRIYYRRVLP